MQEFSSVTASSYDAESLAPLLNEKAADGWSVVSIVAAGTNIVAYLQRETDGAPAAETPAAETPVEETPAVDEPAADAPFVPAAAAAVAVEEAPAAVDEPAGWATAPDETADAAADTTDSSIADLAAQVSEPEPDRTRAGCRRAGGRGRTRRRVDRAGRLVRRSVGPVRAALLGRRCVDRARVTCGPAVHRPARRLIAPRPSAIRPDPRLVVVLGPVGSAAVA